MKNKTFKKIVCLAISVLLVACVPVGMTSNTVQAAGKKAKAMKAYKKELKRIEAKESTSNREFAIYDVNHDGMPELVTNFCKDSVLGALYTFTGKKVTEVSIVHLGHGGFCFYRKGKVFQTSGENFGHYGELYHSILKGKSKELASFTDDSGSLSKNAVGPEYKIGSKKVSKKKYNAYVKKLTKNSKIVNLKYHKLTKANINKYCK